MGKESINIVLKSSEGIDESIESLTDILQTLVIMEMLKEITPSSTLEYKKDYIVKRFSEINEISEAVGKWAVKKVLEDRIKNGDLN
jgi:uncharacterized protein YabN with tetrapyrrole methylase and pyrophosphatase domain